MDDSNRLIEDRSTTQSSGTNGVYHLFRFFQSIACNGGIGSYHPREFRRDDNLRNFIKLLERQVRCDFEENRFRLLVVLLQSGEKMGQWFFFLERSQPWCIRR